MIDLIKHKMNRLPFNKKLVRKFVIESRNKGMSDQEIFIIFCKECENKDKIENIILTTVKPELKEKYKWWNRIFIGLMVCQIAIGALIFSKTQILLSFDFVMYAIILLSNLYFI